MKILSIENEYDSIKPVFNAIERLLLKEQMEKIKCDKSQDVPWSSIRSFDAIFVDISLATKSELDGYGILKIIKDSYSDVIPRVAIITGNDKIKEMMSARGLSNSEFRIFEKPLRYKEIAHFIISNKI